MKLGFWQEVEDIIFNYGKTAQMEYYGAQLFYALMLNSWLAF